MKIFFKFIYFSLFCINIMACKKRCDYCNLREFNYGSMTCEKLDTIKDLGDVCVELEPFIGYRGGRLVLAFAAKGETFTYIQFREIEPDVYFANYQCTNYFVERKKGIWALHRTGMMHCAFYKIKDGNLYCASRSESLTTSLLDEFNIIKNEIMYSRCLVLPEYDFDTRIIQRGCYR